MMNGKVQRQVVTSGRLTGSVRVSRMSPEPAILPEPVYSLYSTDSEDQVTTLHKDLDQCAALLSDIVRVDKAASPCLPRTFKGGATKSRQSAALGKKNIKKLPTKTASVGLPRTVKTGAAKSRPSTSHGKATTKKLPSKTDYKSSPSDRHGANSSTPRSLQSAGPAPRSAVQVDLLGKPSLPFHSSAAQKQALQHHSNSVPRLQTSVTPFKPETFIHQPGKLSASASGPPSLHQPDCQSSFRVPQRHSDEDCDGEEDFVPVKDTNMQTSAANSETDVRHPRLHIDTCTLRMSNLQLEPGQDEKVAVDTCSRAERCAETEVKAKTVRYLLEELKALITGRGSVAERLLSLLEQSVSSLQMTISSSNIQTESVPDMSSLHSQNSQPLRLVIRNEQPKERETVENHPKQETLSNSEALSLQEQLITAQSRLQELQDDFRGLRKALQDTQSQLSDTEAENALMKTELEDTRSRLLESEREKSELARLAQRRLEEMGHLKRLFHIRGSSLSHADGSVSETKQQPPKQDAALHPSTDHINQYLMSLRDMEPPHTEHVRTAAERDGNVLGDSLLHDHVSSQQSDKPAETLAHRENPDRSRSGLDDVQSCGQKASRHWFNSTSQCDVESVWSNWSMWSGSTFDTRDEVAFQDGLAALDASIASLQKTIQLDLRK